MTYLGEKDCKSLLRIIDIVYSSQSSLLKTFCS